jgi:hypothetical protein
MRDLTWEKIKSDPGILAICNSLEMVCAIPAELEKLDENRRILWAALLDSWLINLRACIEYFKLKEETTSKPKDFSVADFAWSYLVVDSKVDFNNLWLIATEWVAHISKKRLITDYEGLVVFDDSPANLSDIANEILNIAKSFAEHLKHINSSDYELFKNHVKQCDEHLATRQN